MIVHLLLKIGFSFLFSIPVLALRNYLTRKKEEKLFFHQRSFWIIFVIILVLAFLLNGIDMSHLHIAH
jgi:hypothetical protein